MSFISSLHCSISATIASLLCTAASWGQPGADRYANAGTSEAAVSRFLSDLQTAVAHDDRPAVLGLFSCPCRVWDGRRSLKLKQAHQLLPRYEAVFDAGLKMAIADAHTEELFPIGRG